MLLIATDIAKGIDIESLSHIINFELPHVPETYVDRIGRTGTCRRKCNSSFFLRSGRKILTTDTHKLISQSIPVMQNHPYQITNPELASKPLRQFRTLVAEEVGVYATIHKYLFN